MCGTPAGAEDLVQETFLRALGAWDSFEGRSEESTWLYTIASRACSRMQRLRAGEPQRLESLEKLLPQGDEASVEIPSAPDPSREAEYREVADAVLGAVVALPLDFRLAFVLKEMVDLSIPEIATILGVKEATVKTRVHRSRLRIRRDVVAVLSRARRRNAPGVDRTREECLALLRAKQEAMDRKAEFPISDAHLCDRCRAVFASLDYTAETCRQLSRETMPVELRRSLEAALAGH